MRLSEEIGQKQDMFVPRWDILRTAVMFEYFQRGGDVVGMTRAALVL